MLSAEKKLSLQAFVLLSILENASCSSGKTAAAAFMLVSSAGAIVVASFCYFLYWSHIIPILRSLFFNSDTSGATNFAKKTPAYLAHIEPCRKKHLVSC